MQPARHFVLGCQNGSLARQVNATYRARRRADQLNGNAYASAVGLAPGENHGH